MIETEVIERDEDLLPNGDGESCLETDCDKKVENVEYPDYLDMNCGYKWRYNKPKRILDAIDFSYFNLWIQRNVLRSKAKDNKNESLI